MEVFKVFRETHFFFTRLLLVQHSSLLPEQAIQEMSETMGASLWTSNCLLTSIKQYPWSKLNQYVFQRGSEPVYFLQNYWKRKAHIVMWSPVLRYQIYVIWWAWMPQLPRGFLWLAGQVPDGQSQVAAVHAYLSVFTGLSGLSVTGSLTSMFALE